VAPRHTSVVQSCCLARDARAGDEAAGFAIALSSGSARGDRDVMPHGTSNRNGGGRRRRHCHLLAATADDDDSDGHDGGTHTTAAATNAAIIGRSWSMLDRTRPVEEDPPPSR
jgi:hypothetical protein